MANILIVDDEQENVSSLKRFLEDAEPTWVISTAQNESSVKTALLAKKFDVVISDLVMVTEQGGMEVLRQVKEVDPLTMVVLITAFEKKLNRYQAFDLGAFDCVQKNTPGVIAADEILVKARAALRFRELALDQIRNEQRLVFLRRYFDPRVFGVIDQSPELLTLKNETITICFWDIRGFSALCETLRAHPTLISDFLRDYFSIAAETIFSNTGVLDKFIGDGVMGIFGALNGKKDEGKQDATNAVKCALEFRGRFEPLVQKWLEQWALYSPQKIDIGLGCGIHTGQALVGNVGTEVREQYTALGPHVNFAQRLESRASKGQILISATTELRVRGNFIVKDAGIINDVKNIPGEFRTYSVTGSV